MGLVELHALRVLEVVDVVVVAEALEFPTVGLTGSPDVAQWVLAVSRDGNSVDDVVLRLVLQAAVVVEGPRAGSRHDVLLEEVLAGRHVAVEEVGAAVVRPPVPVGRKIINLGDLRSGSKIRS